MIAALNASHITKAYGQVRVLVNVDLEINRSEIVALMGPNGSGKSTFLGCITGTVIPDSGDVWIGQRNLKREPVEARRRLRYLPQELDAPSGLTGTEILRFYAQVFGDPAGQQAASEMADLGAAQDHLATTYSVGMRRRLMFAGLVPGDAELYVLDEPFAGLDAESRARLCDFLRRRLEAGSGVLLAAHDQDEPELDALGARRHRVESSAGIAHSLKPSD
ncbi:MAG: ABC transporter ATP-binding protein [Nannocystaceae bacterium]